MLHLDIGYVLVLFFIAVMSKNKPEEKVGLVYMLQAITEGTQGRIPDTRMEVETMAKHCLLAFSPWVAQGGSASAGFSLPYLSAINKKAH